MRIALIPIESTSREIESKTFLASELFSNGWIVIVGKKKFILDWVKNQNIVETNYENTLNELRKKGLLE